MSSFRTQFQIPLPGFDIQHHHSLMVIGSCFAEHIGARLKAFKFKATLNPFGILYHPVAIATALQHLFHSTSFLEKDLRFHNGLWHSFDHHGRFNRPEAGEVLRGINTELAAGAAAIREADFLLLTLGTSSVFTLKETGKIVANCHKLPGYNFDRKRLSVQEIMDAFTPPFKEFIRQRPAGRIMLTVSPVRHLREGFVENQRSKAVLILAVEALCREFDFVSYFPAYELLLDDLRDYRFYAEDMIHPAQVATDYIWSHWSSTYFKEETRQIIRALERIQTSLSHRPFQPESAAHFEFLEKLQREINTLEAQWPFLDFSEERCRSRNIKPA
jgi:hypothetical protein